MPNKLNIAGKRFGKLLVIRESGRDGYGAYLWLCKCDCGMETTARGSQIKSGATRSCGCGIAMTATLRQTTHGKSRTRLYRQWRAMIDRTGNQNNSEFANYGGRGIVVCARWKESFEAFASDVGTPPTDNHSLDRYPNNNGNYEPGNVRWATRSEQNRNRRNNHIVTFRGRELTVQDWAELLGIKPNTIIYRIRRGWDLERALTKGVSESVLLEFANKEQ